MLFLQVDSDSHATSACLWHVPDIIMEGKVHILRKTLGFFGVCCII